MLPIKAWAIYYADGSKFTSEDGTWAQAPPFAVDAVVYYHDDGLKDIEAGIDHYLCKDPSQISYHKMGLWHDSEGFYRVIRRAYDGRWEVTP